MKNNCILFFTFLTLSLLISCKDQNPAQPKQTPIVTVKTVTIKLGDIENYIILNGKTVYLKKNSIVSPISGYIVKINVKFGDKVQKNEVLFEIQTKENKALINTGSIPRNIGIIKVLASSDGYINELNITETGGYLTEGGMLCSIVDNKNLMLQVNVPFQYNELIKKATKCKIFLADNTQFEGIVSQILPVIKEAEQTQTVLIKPITNKKIPENLNIKVEFINSKHFFSSKSGSNVQ